MIKNIIPYWTIILVFAIQVAACSSESQVKDSLDEEIPLAPLGRSGSMEGSYELFISANFEGPGGTFPDTFVSEWAGFFTIDSNGGIEGEGEFSYLALSYLLFEISGDCGYVWSEEGVYDYAIGGSVVSNNGNIQLQISSLILRPGTEFEGPNQTCPGIADAVIDDPSMQGYGAIRRNVMYEAVIIHLNNGAIVFRADAPINIELGGVTYTIKINYIGPALAPLEP